MRLCVFLFWWYIHRHLRIPLAPLSLVHVRLTKPPEPNIHPELSILAQTLNTLSKLSVVEDDPQCSRTFDIRQYWMIQKTPCWIPVYFFLYIFKVFKQFSMVLQNGRVDRREGKVLPVLQNI